MPASGAPDAAGLTKDLTGLVKQMLGVIKQDPTAKTALAELATDAQASLKRGDLEQAAAGIEILREAIESYSSGSGNDADGGTKNANRTGAPDDDDAGGSTKAQSADGSDPNDGSDPSDTRVNNGADRGADTGADSDQDGGSRKGKGAGPSVQTFHKSRVAWTATRAKVDKELQKLSKAILDASEGEEMVEGLEDQFFKVVDPVLAELDETLSETLQEAAEADGAERERLLGDARKTIARYTNFVSSNSIISDLDNNPFVPLSIGKTLTSTLATLSSIMR